jgi:hypothetical protein
MHCSALTFVWVPSLSPYGQTSSRARGVASKATRVPSVETAEKRHFLDSYPFLIRFGVKITDTGWSRAAHLMSPGGRRSLRQTAIREQSAPVIQRASSEARKTTTAAISSRWPSRLRVAPRPREPARFPHKAGRERHASRPGSGINRTSRHRVEGKSGRNVDDPPTPVVMIIGTFLS